MLTGKELMVPDELAVMDGGKCILQVQWVRPFFIDKFDITKRPQYKYLSDSDPKNTFDAAKFVKRRLKVKPEDPMKFSVSTFLGFILHFRLHPLQIPRRHTPKAGFPRKNVHICSRCRDDCGMLFFV